GCLLADFGVKKMPPKLGYLSIVLKYVADSDRGIREACYGVLVELAAWIDISELIKEMDEPQKKEVAKRLEAKEEKTQPKRLYRGEAPATATAASAGELFDKVDPFKKLPKGWCMSAVNSMEKWKEKLQHLQVFSSLLEGPAEQHMLQADAQTLQPLAVTLQRLLKSESNIPVLTEVAKCMGLLARGLRRHFERCARQLLPVALARINDKSVWKPNCLIERVEQLLWSLPLDALLEELTGHICSKSLFVKKEAMSLLLRALELPQVQDMYPDALQRFFPTCASMVVPLIDDSDNTVRQEAAKTLAKLASSNQDAADQLVAARLPAHRRNLYEEEVRKLGGAFMGKDAASPPELRSVPTPLSPATTLSLRASPLKKLQAVTVEPERPLKPLWQA
ncbi:unnamed protein product, partial [Effrenium voratum]